MDKLEPHSHELDPLRSWTTEAVKKWLHTYISRQLITASPAQDENRKVSTPSQIGLPAMPLVRVRRILANRGIESAAHMPTRLLQKPIDPEPAIDPDQSLRILIAFPTAYKAIQRVVNEMITHFEEQYPQTKIDLLASTTRNRVFTQDDMELSNLMHEITFDDGKPVLVPAVFSAEHTLRQHAKHMVHEYDVVLHIGKLADVVGQWYFQSLQPTDTPPDTAAESALQVHFDPLTHRFGILKS